MARAARLANIHDRVLELPYGYDTVIGEDARLYGGEAQRVALARPLPADTPVVLLDEVTSTLNPFGEAAVHVGTERLMTGRTVVMVSHRMRTVRRADRIVFLDAGRVVEEGGHEELPRRGGRYAELWNLSLIPAAEA